MNLDFTEEQIMLRDAAARFFAAECTYEAVKRIEDSAMGYEPALWKKIAELGWMGLPFPSRYGGYDGAFLDLVILQEEMGKAVFPTPFFSTVVQCGLLVLAGGTEEQKAELLGRIAGGGLIMALARYEAETDYSAESIMMTAEPEDSGFILNGTKMFVLDANIAERLIVAARTGNAGISLFLVDTATPGIRITKLPTVAKDNTCEVVFEHVAVEKDNLLGPPGGGGALLDRMDVKATVAKAAEITGGCRACIDMTARLCQDQGAIRQSHRRVPGHSAFHGRYAAALRYNEQLPVPGGLPD